MIELQRMHILSLGRSGRSEYLALSPVAPRRDIYIASSTPATKSTCQSPDLSAYLAQGENQCFERGDSNAGGIVKGGTRVEMYVPLVVVGASGLMVGCLFSLAVYKSALGRVEGWDNGAEVVEMVGRLEKGDRMRAGHYKEWRMALEQSS